MITFAPTESPTLADAVTSAIRTAIIEGSLKPGERLLENNIAAQMRLSRGPVREALRLLEKEGLVTRVPRKGSCVTALTRDDVEELYSFRSALEGFGIRRAMQYVRPEDIARLTDMVARIRQILRTENAPAKNDLTLQFHREIIMLSRHRRLLEAWTNIGRQVWLCSALATRMHLSLAPQILTHEDILLALKSGDVDQAERTIREHILATGRAVLDRFGK